MPLLFRPCLALLLSALAFNALAQQPPAQPTPGQPSQLPTNPPARPPAASAEEDPIVQTVRLPDADLDTVLTALEIYTGRIILRPAALPTATYNIKITKPTPRSAVIRYLETVLALNGIAVVPLDSGAFKVTASTMARMEAPEFITGSTLDLAPSGRVATKLFQLEFIRANELTPMINGIMNVNYGGPQLLPNANAFLITDSISNLQRIEALLQQIDKPISAGMKPKFYQLKHGAKASDIVTKLRTIISGTLMQQIGTATSYSADDRTNQIILVTDARQHAFFDELIEQLDQRSDPNTRNDVIQLNHAKASEVVTVITTLLRGQSAAVQSARQGAVRPGTGLQGPQPGAPTTMPLPGQPGQPPPVISGSTAGSGMDALLGGSSEFSGIVTVVNDERTNSVVVSGTTDDIRLLRELVAKLDIVLAQVRIEVVIAEVTFSDNHQSGISALGLKIDGDKLVGFSVTEQSFAAEGTITRPGITGRFDLAAEIGINITPRKTNSTILSVPAIVTSHGKAGEIFNGESRPTVSGTTIAPGSSAGLTQQSQINQTPIGTRLTVTPFIGADGSVFLDIKQRVEEVTDRVVIEGNEQYVIGLRETTSFVTAKSGEIVVLGGFQKKTDLKTTSRLGPIPILGDLFGARTKNQTRQELLFFLRPTVLTNNPAVDNAGPMNRIEQLPQREEIKKQLDPKYQPMAKPSAIDRILPK